MKLSAACVPLAFVVSVALALAAEPASSHEAEGNEHNDHTTLWKTLNFAILAGGVGYFVKKHGANFFRNRTETIQRDIAEAARTREKAEARAVEMDRRMANLEAEIADLRRSWREEMAAEETRLKAATEQMLARIQANAEHEIASAVTHARKELRTYSAELALGLAREKIRRRMTPEVADRLVNSFVSEVSRSSRRAG